MNINIVLDSEYICKELSETDGAIRIANFLMFMKHKSNIIILQDKKQQIVRDILRQLAFNFEKMENNELNDAQIFLLELAKGTNHYDFITDEENINDFATFVKNLKDKNYPLKMVISDKKFDTGIESYSIEEISKIISLIEQYSKKYIISDNKKLNSKEKKMNIINFDDYKEILFHTFWCSDEITIVAKEFYEGFFYFNKDKDKEKFFREGNRKRYEEGLIFLFECFKEIEKFTKKKLLIKVISGLKPNYIKKFAYEGKTKVDELYNFIKQINENFSFELKLIKWDSGDEIDTGEGHGRRIYSDYGGFDTGYMPFEIHKDDPKKGGIITKDTSISWIDEQSYLEWSKIGDVISSRQP
jgi:hypothetical protein